jgi:hypothetical protein
MNLEAASADESAGMEWWNALTEEQRAYWLDAANTANRRRSVGLPQTRCVAASGLSAAALYVQNNGWTEAAGGDD